MSKVPVRKYDPARCLISLELIRMFLEEALETDSLNYMKKSIKIAAVAEGMLSFSKCTGLPLDNLYDLTNSENITELELKEFISHLIKSLPSLEKQAKAP